MEPSQRIPIIAGIVGFAADIIGIGTFLIALQSPDHHVGKAVPIMILVVIGYSWFILSWAIARGAILREIRDRGHRRPSKRGIYRFASSVAVGVLASPIVLLTTTGIYYSKEAVYIAGLAMAFLAVVIFGLLSVLMPLVHDESVYK